jgi:WD40 repeat protein
MLTNRQNRFCLRLFCITAALTLGWGVPKPAHSQDAATPVTLSPLPIAAELPPINIANAKPLAPLPGISATGASLNLSPNGQQLAAGYFNGALRVWNLADGKATDVTGHKAGITAVRFNPAGDQIATSGMDNTIQIWANPPAAMPAKTLAGSTRWVRDLAYTPDGTRLVSVGDDRNVRIWNLADGKVLHTLAGHTDWVLAVSVRGDGHLAATGGYDRTIRLWDLDKGALVKARLWNPADGAQVREFPGHVDELHSVAIHPGGKFLATAGADRNILIWNLTTGEKLKSLDGPTSWVHGLAWSANGARLASIGADQVARIWEFPVN